MENNSRLIATVPDGARARPGIMAWSAAAVWTTGFGFTVVASDLINLRFRDQWLPLLAMSALVVAAHYRLLLVLLRYANPGLLLVLGWALFSAAWSAVPGYAVTQAIAVVGVAVIASAFALAGWQPDRFALRLAGVATVLIVASIFYAVVFPERGIHSGTDVSLLNSWRGVTVQKNGLGQLCAVGTIVWTYLWAARKVSTWIAVLGLGLSLFVLLQSRSSTSLMLAVLCSAGTVALLRPPLNVGPLLRRSITGAIVVLIPSATYMAVATPYLGFIGAFFGKDMTFSGRVQIWEALMEEIALHPWLGTGLSSFWGEMDAGEMRVRAIVGWPVRDSHNGYITVANELGLIGLSLFFAFLILHCVALRRLSHISRSQYALHAPLFAYIVLANTSESGWFFPISITHLVGTYVSVEVSRLLLEHGLRRRRQPEPRTPPTAPQFAHLAGARAVADTAPSPRNIE